MDAAIADAVVVGATPGIDAVIDVVLTILSTRTQSATAVFSTAPQS